MAGSGVVESLAGIAAGQWGMFTTAQAEAAGVSRHEVARMVRRQVVRRVRQGVHVMAGVPSDEFEGVRAVWLATDPSRTMSERYGDPDPVVVCDETAAAIHQIGDLPGSGVHLCAARRLQTRQARVNFHRRELGEAEYQWVGGLPVTTPRRTLEDLVSSQRWERDQLRNLVSDAIMRGLIPRDDVMRSTVLSQALAELAPPASHAALRQRLANDARARGADPGDEYNAFFRMLFTDALMRHEGWVLKGGSNLLCRLERPRSTNDLDLFRRGSADADEAAGQLRDAMHGLKVGRYTFQVGAQARGAGEETDVLRVKVSAMDGATEVATFNIDLSGNVVLSGSTPPLVEVPRIDGAVLAGYPSRFKVRLYPVENQVADKLCAMYSRYGSGPSTRYRDLYDLALVADQLRIDQTRLVEALQTQQQIRGMLVPADLPEPAPGWAAAYDKQLRRNPSAHPPHTSYAHAMAIVKASFSAAVEAGRPVR